jgi:hypothetical protein
MCMQLSTVHAELPVLLDPGAVRANIVDATAPADGILTDTGPSREHERCPLPPGVFFVSVLHAASSVFLLLLLLLLLLFLRACV